MENASRPEGGSGGGGVLARLLGPKVGERLAGPALFYAVLEVGGAAIIFAGQVIGARILGAEHYGLFLVVLAWVNLAALPGRVGLDVSAVRFFSLYRSRKDWGLLRGFHQFSIVALGIAAGVAGAAVAAVGWAATEEPSLRLAYVAGGLTVPLIAYSQYCDAALRGLRHVVLPRVAISLVRPTVLLMALPALAWSLPAEDGAFAAVVANLLGAALATGYLIVALHRLVPAEAKRSPAVRVNREWLSVSASMLFVSGSAMVLIQTNVILVEYFAGAAAAGLYGAASRFVGLLNLVLIAVTTVASPVFAAMGEDADRQSMQRLASLCNAWMALLTGLGVGVLAVFGRWGLSLMGGEFQAAYGVLMVLCLGQMVLVLSSPSLHVLNMRGHQNASALILGLAAAINLAATAILVPRFGVEGAAWAVVVSNFWISVATARMTWRRTGVVAFLYPPTLLAALRR